MCLFVFRRGFVSPVNYSLEFINPCELLLDRQEEKKNSFRDTKHHVGLLLTSDDCLSSFPL